MQSIPWANRHLDVYISSTFQDLKTYRQRVIQAVLDIGYHPVAMENYGAVASYPLEKCLADVRACDVYVLLVAWRYGCTPEGHTESITALEYREAVKQGKLRLVFMLDDDAYWPLSQVDGNTIQIKAFRAELLDTNIVALWNGDEKDLTAKVLTGLAKIANPIEPERNEAWFLPHPYPMPPHFTGRMAERHMLDEWLTEDSEHPLLIVQALGGFGKSALTWHWLTHDVDSEHWPRVVWWSFYESQANFRNFLPRILCYLTGRDACHLGQKQQVDELLQCLRKPGVLLVLDGFERELKAYGGMGAAYQGDEIVEQRDCVNSEAEIFLRNVSVLPQLRGKVLMTTRLRPKAVEVHGGMLLQGCREEMLAELKPEDAIAFFRTQRVQGTRAELEQAGLVYGYHPLSLRLLVGMVMNDLVHPGNIGACHHADLNKELVQRKQHVLKQSYQNLTPERQKLLSRIACFRSPVTYEALVVVADGLEASVSEDRLAQDHTHDEDFRDLVNRGLLQRDQNTNQFDLHPIVRRYAYDQMLDTERIMVHEQLVDYFAAVPTVEAVKTIDDLTPIIELYYHMVRAGQYDKACDLFYERINQSTHYRFGAYQLRIDLLSSLFTQDKNQLPKLADEDDQGWIISALANSYSFSGQPAKAIPLYEMDIQILEKQGDKENLAITLGNLADMSQVSIGDLQAAEANLRRRIALSLEIKSQRNEASAHRQLGRLRAYQGIWKDSEQELKTALEQFDKQSQIQPQGIIWACRSLQLLLLIREIDDEEQQQELAEKALVAAQRSLDIAKETAQTMRPNPRDYVRSQWRLGAAHRVKGNFNDSDTYLNKALTLCRAINMVGFEADILLDLAQLRAAQNQIDEALKLAQEALRITKRSGYVLQGADVNLFLAKSALARNLQQQALDHAQSARKLATCNGPPNYTYKVTYDEAGALLAKLNHGKEQDACI